ncbi:hypothetical protein O9G_000286 [Rozella allomycis CSF55]|uniref:Uncharacterized protein n=1 Tax=Rozella allomycis (strain CSF55) TaxID=988480 RepID=A0A075ATE7_ROZAC|nr:hypothetical protein O9G_000286 [Rozella allomycis CSF55]|eukprot:EPZ31807.1 hypothetical protein O9G_000286 [Rozella allomycis CSF55]
MEDIKNIYNFKRPKLIKLCKKYNIKATGSKSGSPVRLEYTSTGKSNRLSLYPKVETFQNAEVSDIVTENIAELKTPNVKRSRKDMEDESDDYHTADEAKLENNKAFESPVLKKSPAVKVDRLVTKTPVSRRETLTKYDQCAFIYCRRKLSYAEKMDRIHQKEFNKMTPLKSAVQKSIESTATPLANTKKMEIIGTPLKYTPKVSKEKLEVDSKLKNTFTPVKPDVITSNMEKIVPAIKEVGTPLKKMKIAIDIPETKKKFDLKASLARPLTYKPHKGPLKKYQDSSRKK